MALPLLAWSLSLALWDLSAERALQRTLSAMSSADPAVRRHLRERLTNTPPDALIRSFRRLPDDRAGKGLLANTVQALAGYDSKVVVPLLIETLGSDQEKVRLRAAMSLAFLGDDALPGVIETLATAPDARARTSAAWTLSLMGNDQPRALEALQVALQDENKDVRYTAKYSLHQLRTSNNLLREAADRLREESSKPDD